MTDCLEQRWCQRKIRATGGGKTAFSDPKLGFSKMNRGEAMFRLASKLIEPQPCRSHSAHTPDQAKGSRTEAAFLVALPDLGAATTAAAAAVCWTVPPKRPRTWTGATVGAVT